MMPKTTLIEVKDLRGGRNGADPPLSLPENQCVEALNVDWYDGMLARKRNGSTAVSDTGGTAFGSGMQTILRHVPGADETAAELWGVDGTAVTPLIKRMAAGTSWANVTQSPTEKISSANAVVGASLNSKLFLAYQSSGNVDRLHVWDGASIRRVGVNTPNAPTVADQGGGAYAAVLRYYRVRLGHFSAASTTATIYRRSEPSASVAFTPSGAGASARITQPTFSADDTGTHWEIEISTDNATWYAARAVGGYQAPLAIGTTFFDDSSAPSTWTSSAPSAPPIGLYSNFPSVKYLVTDGNRLIGGGAWESSGAISGGKNSRIWFSPVLGSADKGDDERVPNMTNLKNWVDINENDGGGITGLGGPVYGAVYAFKLRNVWKLTPTGDINAPYLPRKIADGVYGCIAHKSIVLAKDALGNPALYFLGTEGPCRIVQTGNSVAMPQYLGRDIEDIWSGINLAATGVLAHGLYHADKHQIWWWIATGANNDPDTKIVFDVLLGKYVEGERVRGGWSKHTGDTAGARCSCMMSNTLGASMSRDLKPYIGRSSGTAVQKCDSTATDDAGTTFQAYVKTKPLAIAPIGRYVGMGQSVLVAKAASGVTITQTVDRDFGLDTARTSTALLTAAGSETRVIKKLEASEIAQANTIQVQLGDASAASNNWVLDGWAAPVHGEDRR